MEESLNKIKEFLTQGNHVTYFLGNKEFFVNDQINNYTYTVRNNEIHFYKESETEKVTLIIGLSLIDSILDLSEGMISINYMSGTELLLLIENY